MNTKASTLLLGLTLTLIACSSGIPGAPSPGTPSPATPAPATPSPATPRPTDPPAADPAGLNGRHFLSVTVTDGGVVRALVAGTVIRLTFQDGQLGASAGCNSMGGTYSIVDGKLIFHGGGMTEMGCDQPRHDQDDWLSAFLGSEPTIALNGNDLVLTSGTTTITLLDREVAEPDQPLVGTTWTLTSIITGEAVSSVPAGVLATIKFNADGSVEIHPGCNTGGGTYATNEDAITFSDLITTEMACLGPAMDVEGAVLAVLSADSITYAIDSGSLTLMAGDHGLVFSAINALDV
ncbi:MAG: META domain-containing protein [Chloroflexota bacterium]